MAQTPSNNVALTLEAEMQTIGQRARTAAALLRETSTESKNTALVGAADAILARREGILAANANDMRAAEVSNLSAALLDRLRLDHDRIEAIAQGLREVALLPDPVGRELARWTQPNGLDITRISTPI